jgi:macrodomain Ter protein organizer (MatP/YcbG family)
MGLLEECASDCPYCGEPITVLIDTSCAEQSYIEDCEVCCQPMTVNVWIDESGEVSFSLHRDDE